MGTLTSARHRRATLADVARQAGVSVSTASRSLRADRRIGERTRNRVAEVADFLGYVPNVAARNLVTQRTLTLGLMIPDVTDPVHGQIVSGFQTHARSLGYSVILANGFQDTDLERQAVAEFAAHRVEGAVLMGTVMPQFDAVRALDPAWVVFVDSEHDRSDGAATDLERGCIRTDDAGGMQQVATLIVECGYRSVAFVGGTPLATETMRSTALAEALAQRDGPTPTCYVDRDLQVNIAQLCLDQPDVVVCYDDKLALATLDALRERGISVPAQMRVIGFDDIPFGRISNPRLTTVSQGAERLGTLAAAMLAHALGHGELPPSTIVPAVLIVRESTTPPGGHP